MAGIQGNNIMEANAQPIHYESDPEEVIMEAPEVGYPGYQPVFVFEDISDDDDMDEMQHDIDLQDAEEVEEATEAIPEVVDVEEEEEEEEDNINYEQIIAVMEEDHEDLLAALQQKAETDRQAAHEKLEVLENLWLDEVEKNHNMKIQLDAYKAEGIRLHASLVAMKNKCLKTLFDIKERIIDFPAEKGKRSYNINKSVVVCMLHKAYDKATKKLIADY